MKIWQQQSSKENDGCGFRLFAKVQFWRGALPAIMSVANTYRTALSPNPERVAVAYPGPCSIQESDMDCDGNFRRMLASSDSRG